MTRPIAAAGLLRTAEKLAGSNAGVGRPAYADLRRATSTAYYALFHQIARHGTFAFLGNATEDQAADIARWYTHTGILKAAQLVVTAASPTPLRGIGRDDRTAVMALRASAGSWPLSPELIRVAESFRSLQEARHDADYDGNYDPYRGATLSHVAEARAAIEATWWLWRSYSTKNPQRQQAHVSYCMFLQLAMMRSGGPKGR